MVSTERLPEPLVDGTVRNDVESRTLVVRRPENASGYQKLWWRTAHQALIQAEQTGWPSSVAPFLWAHSGGQPILPTGCRATIWRCCSIFRSARMRTQNWSRSRGWRLLFRSTRGLAGLCQ
jgi:hypothetical protein